MTDSVSDVDFGYPPDVWDESSQDKREDDWRKGIHVDQSGKEWKLSQMTTNHIENTINYFEGYDSKPLLKELKKRK